MKTSTIEIAKLLPGENCGECGCSVCIGFASSLFAGKVSLDGCPHLDTQDIRALQAMVQPPVKEIKIGRGERTVRVGGEKVMYRHELKFFNPTAVALSFPDTLSKEELVEKLTRVKKLAFQKGDATLRTDLVVLRSVSQSAKTFADALQVVKGECDLPLVLASRDPSIVAEGLRFAGEDGPLIAGACADNWREMVPLAREYCLPLALEAPPEEMERFVARTEDAGISDLVLMPKTGSLSETAGELARMRHLAISEGRFGYPSMAQVPDGMPKFQEMCWATALMLNYCGLMVLSVDEPHYIFPLLTLRQSIFADPTVPAKVKPGMYSFGTPNEDSPVMLTGNFSMTFSTVSSDLRAGNVSSYLLVADTQGFAVGISVLLRKITGEAVSALVNDTAVRDKISHNRLIIPGLMEPLKKEIEEASKLQVVVGPLESVQIPAFIRTDWQRA